jgi:CheY-like chemotaxis protein
MAGSVNNYILLVDDSEDDIALIRHGLRKEGVTNEIISFPDAERFLDYMDLVLRGGETVPGLVLLDINMPGMSGHEALRRMRAIKEFEKIPAVAIVSHSKAQQDIEEAMRSGATGYLTKPATSEEWRAFGDFIKERLRENFKG